MVYRMLGVLFACFSIAIAAARVEAATIAVGPYTPSTTPFIVPVVVADAVNLDAFTFDLAYDPTAFVINTGCDPFADTFCDFVTGPVTPGNFYGGSLFPSLFNPGFILLDTMGTQIGSPLAVNGAWQGFGPAPSGSGVLAYIDFIAVPGGSSTAPIVVVGPRAVPEPSTLAVIAVAGLGAIRRRRRCAVPH